MAVLSVLFVVASSALTATEALPKQDAVADFLNAALPEVDYYMQEPTGLSNDFKAKAELLKQQVAANEQEKKTALKQLKTSFEENLTAQALRSDQLGTDNQVLLALISQEESRIAILRQDASKLQKSNEIMRRALDGLVSKVHAVSDFLDDSIEVSEEFNASELDVLRPTTPQPTVEHFLETMGDHKVSLLGVAAAKKKLLKRKKEEPKPELILESLPQHLVDLAALGEQGEAQLQARFLAMYEFGAARQAELLAHKEQLQQELGSKEELTAQVLGVKKHLRQIKAQLRQRVNVMRTFALKVNELATVSLDTAAKVYEESTH